MEEFAIQYIYCAKIQNVKPRTKLYDSVEIYLKKLKIKIQFVSET